MMADDGLTGVLFALWVMAWLGGSLYLLLMGKPDWANSWALGNMCLFMLGVAGSVVLGWIEER
jgi:hypothetical protein